MFISLAQTHTADSTFHQLEIAMEYRIKNGSDISIYVPWWKDIVRTDRILNSV